MALNDLRRLVLDDLAYMDRLLLRDTEFDASAYIEAVNDAAGYIFERAARRCTLLEPKP